MGLCFQGADLLLPKAKNFESWAVIACDQHTSDPAYWQQVRENVGANYSTLDIMLPEAELHLMDDSRIQSISDTMGAYLEKGVFEEFPNSFVYVERQLQDGSIRQGIVGVIDLECYDVEPKADTKVFATEGIVPERLPPRIRIRKKASLEVSHCVVFCDDKEDKLMASICSRKDSLEKLYDFDLMCGGGHIAGWLVSGEDSARLETVLCEYEQENIYLVGDGNHSLLTAKRCYEALKQTQPKEVWENSPARYAMVELENIHSPAMCFEAIYRVVDQTDAAALMDAMQKLSTPDGTPVQMISGDKCVEVRLPVGENELVVGVLQNTLDAWLKEKTGNIDYIHGKDVLTQLAQKTGAVGFLLPDFDKSLLFPYIRSGNITPRKTFSIGQAAEKRYYLEGRKIV